MIVRSHKINRVVDDVLIRLRHGAHRNGVLDCSARDELPTSVLPTPTLYSNLLSPDMAMGLGYHFWDVPAADWMIPFQVYTLAGTMVYSLSLAFSKISILFLYLRLSTVRWFRILVWILLGIVISYAVIYNLMSLFGCKPIAATWDQNLAATAKCLDQLTKYEALSILNIIVCTMEAW